VPGYRLQHFLGRGGWGEVWKASDPNGNDVALKFIPCENQTLAAQEIRGLQAIRQLEHPNLLRIEHIWTVPGYILIAMEMAQGSLLDLFNVYHSDLGQPIFPEHVCYFLEQAAEALDYLNTRQHMFNGNRVAVRHCDVKPSNLLIMDKHIKLADFSVSVQSSTPTCQFRRAGTLAYSAPEVFQGYLTERTDQYALGVTYCQLRGGRLPFTDTPSTFTRNYTRPPPDLSMLTPPERPIIAKALHPVPQDRWPSCATLIERLADIMVSVTITSL